MSRCEISLKPHIRLGKSIMAHKKAVVQHCGKVMSNVWKNILKIRLLFDEQFLVEIWQQRKLKSIQLQMIIIWRFTGAIWTGHSCS